MSDRVPASRSIYLHEPFVVDAQGVHALDALFAELASEFPIRVSVKLADGTDLALNGIAAINALPNTGPQAIQSVAIATSEEAHNTMTVTLGADSYRLLAYDLNGDLRHVNHFGTALDAIFSCARPWYAPIAKIPSYAVGLVFVVAELAVVFCFALYNSVANTPARTPLDRGGVAAVLIILAALSLPPLAGLLWHRFGRRLFPKTVFAINAGAAAHRKRAKLQWVAVGAFTIVVVIAGVAVLSVL